MNAEPGIWNKLTRLVVFLLFVAFVLGVWVWYLPLIKENEWIRKDILAKEEKIQKARAEGRQLSNESEALRNDRKTVERIVRGNLGYAKPGETVYRFESPATNGFH